MLIKTKLQFLILGVVFTTILFTTCNQPLGMGEPIDWEAPVLIMDPVPNPLYVRSDTVLTGTVTDNIGVERVIFTNSSTGKEIFPVLVDGNNWSIKLDFTEEQNGEKIIGEIRAYDKMNNSDGNSVAIVTMIIDIGPPKVGNITIQRTDTRIARLESLNSLKALETEDRNGEKKDYLYNYQNGWFYLSGVVNDEETKIDVISLDIYDVRDINYKLLSLPADAGYTNYFPRWTVKEELLIDAGKAKWGGEYKTNYYKKDGERYYYRIVIKAMDMSENINVFNVTFEEDEGYICMFAKSDEPKGILDPAIGTAADGTTIVSRGTPLPIDFYDDDSIDWAYAGLLTYEQWAGLNAVCAGDVKIPSSLSDEKKLEWLKDKLREGSAVYNWRFDGDRPYKDTSKEAIIAEQIEGKKIDEKLVYVPTGNKEEDYGDFVLFTLASDKKLEPHDKKGPEDTNKDRWAGRFLRIQVIDENAPLIVFDTTKTDALGRPKDFCPEENTFPTPLINGETFNIVGYTLRENASENNSVVKFRMAWIPYGMPDNADKWIPAVQKALTSDSFTGMPEGVQYWEFVEGGTLQNQKGNFKNEGQEKIPEDDKLKPGEIQSIYKKQSFTKKFNVLGGSDDIKPATNNFMYNGKLENETKLFIFYAEDNMGHQVFRQLRLLGMKIPPDLTIFDISNKFNNESLPSGIPDPNKAENINVGTGIPTDAYYDSLRTFNNTVYSNLKTVRVEQDDKTVPFQIYPRGTIVKYWINAAKTGDIAIKTISMKDITFEVEEGKHIFIGSEYNETDGALSYCEYFPDVTQRTFLFEATDKLGNIAQVQRTIAITNAARLENITTNTQNGTYGINDRIVLTANFSSQIYLEGGRPYLNVRYKVKGKMEKNGYEYERIQCDNYPTINDPSLSLNFTFTIRENYIGQLETTYENMPGDIPSLDDSRPIYMYTARIMDYIRKDPAFIPGIKNELITMPNWQSAANTLQGTLEKPKKTIILDGIRPNITSIAMGGKTPYATGSTTDYYFKNGESIELTLTADKPVKISTNPEFQSLRIRIQDQNNVQQGPFDTLFKYLRPGVDSHMLVFSLPVSDIAYSGKLTEVSLATAGAILDEVGNSVSVTSPFPQAPKASENYFIKKTVPPAPQAPRAVATLNDTAFASADTYYASSPTLEIPVSDAPVFAAWEDVRQYSLDGGMTWNNYTATVHVPGGTHRLRARYVDRAGNEGTATTEKTIQVNSNFPALVSVTAVEPNGWYKSGDLTFNLNFNEAVRVLDDATGTINAITITVTNRALYNSDNTGGDSNSFEKTIIVNTGQTSITRTGSSTIKFTWSGIGTAGNRKEMRDGLYISEVKLDGLRDIYGNTGPAIGSSTWNGNIYVGGNSCPNLPYGGAEACIKVDAIAPRIDTYNPASADVSSDNRTITLTFNEPVMTGIGSITLKPHGDYRIPAVFEDNGYYLGTDGTRYSTPQSDATGKKTTTWVAGFYDIYNTLTDSTNRNYLTQGTSMTNLTLDMRTGRNAGPYIKITHGLKEGAGYTGNYSTGANGPNPEGTAGTTTARMVPDTSTKWVLDYRYSITDNAYNTPYVDLSNNEQTADTSVVPNIRAALTSAKWRWQEMDMVSSVKITDKTAVITLNEPLLEGLQWDLSFTDGAFTDIAGNNASASQSGYWFWSSGVQAPVIRVNRKSFDARSRTAPVPAATSGTFGNLDYSWQDFRRVYSVPADKDGPGGWGIGDFNTIHYKIETETPGATIFFDTYEGSTTGTERGSVTAAWDNTAIGTSGRVWNDPGVNTSAGEWVLPNLIRRSGTGTYNVTENGFSITRTITADHHGYRSFNRDILKSDLVTAANLTNNGGDSYQGSFTYSALQASKNYVVAQARIGANPNYTYSKKGYEGVFRSVIAFNQASFAGYMNGGNLYRGPAFVLGSNIKNGMPSIAGFPVRDAQETDDNRFLKLYYYVGRNSAAAGDTAIGSGQLYWVSTEIVCQWYNQNASHQNQTNTANTGGCGTHQNNGDANNYLFSGYGDLTYTRNQR